MLMSEYGWTLKYVLSLTKSQIILFSKIASIRIGRQNKFLASIHDKKLDSKTLDIDGAVPIENICKRGGTL